jgi:hypothetical protein
MPYPYVYDSNLNDTNSAKGNGACGESRGLFCLKGEYP